MIIRVEEQVSCHMCKLDAWAKTVIDLIEDRSTCHCCSSDDVFTKWSRKLPPGWDHLPDPDDFWVTRDFCPECAERVRKKLEELELTKKHIAAVEKMHKDRAPRKKIQK